MWKNINDTFISHILGSALSIIFVDVCVITGFGISLSLVNRSNAYLRKSNELLRNHYGFTEEEYDPEIVR